MSLDESLTRVVDKHLDNAAMAPPEAILGRRDEKIDPVPPKRRSERLWGIKFSVIKGSYAIAFAVERSPSHGPSIHVWRSAQRNGRDTALSHRSRPTLALRNDGLSVALRLLPQRAQDERKRGGSTRRRRKAREGVLVGPRGARRGRRPPHRTLQAQRAYAADELLGPSWGSERQDRQRNRRPAGQPLPQARCSRGLARPPCPRAVVHAASPCRAAEEVLRRRADDPHV